MKYYYTDPLAAAWMAKHHNFQYVGLENVFEDINDFAHVVAEYDGLFIIHPDSQHLLEPQVGDVIISGRQGNVGYMPADDGFMGELARTTIRRAWHTSDRIIQRKGLPFMWPVL